MMKDTIKNNSYFKINNILEIKNNKNLNIYIEVSSIENINKELFKHLEKKEISYSVLLNFNIGSKEEEVLKNVSDFIIDLEYLINRKSSFSILLHSKYKKIENFWVIEKLHKKNVNFLTF